MLKPIVCLSLMVAGAAANAADNGLYLGLGAGKSQFDVPFATEDKDDSYKAIVGFRALDSLGFEVNYADHGEARLPTGIACIALVGVNCPSTVNVSAKTTSGFAVGFLDFPLLDLFAKAGIASVKSDVRAAGIGNFGLGDSTTEFAWGAGIQAHFGSLGARAEYEHFKIFQDRKLEMISVSFLYTFL